MPFANKQKARYVLNPANTDKLTKAMPEAPTGDYHTPILKII